jgi:hypothetical protein
MEQSVGELHECAKCQRKIVVERILDGSSNTIKSIVHCWDCLSQEDQENYIKTYNWPHWK